MHDLSSDAILLNWEAGQRQNIVWWPDPVLSRAAKPIENFNKELSDLAIDMLKTMYLAPGIGLAAPQINFSLSLLVLDVDFEREESQESMQGPEHLLKNLNPRAFVNPEILETHGSSTYQEGCLSLPGIFEDITRPAQALIRYQDLQGKFHEEEVKDLLCTCLLHEIDHLEGKMFLDYLGPVKRSIYRKKMLKEKKKRM